MGNARVTTRDLELVAANGKLELLKYLCEHCHTYSNTALMDAAASAGHLEAVQYLYEDYLHENANDTAALLMKAAAGGHFEVVKYLYEDCRYDYSSCAQLFGKAAESGNVEVIRYLHDKGHIGNVHNPANLLKKMHIDSYVFLLENGYVGKIDNECLDKTARDAIYRDNLKALASLHHLGAKIPDSRAQETIEFAMRNRSVEMIKYLHEEMGLPLGERAREIMAKRMLHQRRDPVATYIQQQLEAAAAQPKAPA